jgi:uncharacterized protein YigA (DUF484 family)
MENQMNNIINEAEVALYLENNPQFFTAHTSLLARMHLPNPHGSGTVSLAERQQAAQREKIHQMERIYSELLQFGIENDEKINKVHKLNLALLNASNLPEITDALNSSLQNDFGLSSSKIMLWAEPKNNEDASLALFDEVDDISKGWAEALTEPYCGKLPDENLVSIKANDDAKSYAITTLEISTPIGILVMASVDEKRFYPEMGTVFVKRLGELLSAAVSRHIV